MPSWLLRRWVLVRINVSKEHIASIIRVERISELETTLTYLATVTANFADSLLILSTPRMKMNISLAPPSSG
jgi:hypothetical protein